MAETDDAKDEEPRKEQLEREDRFLREFLQYPKVHPLTSVVEMYQRAYQEMVAKTAEKESLLAKLQSADVLNDPIVKAVFDSMRAELDGAYEQIAVLKRRIDSQNDS
jgi:hypothetical protein